MTISEMDSFNLVVTEQKDLIRRLREETPFNSETAYFSFRDECKAASVTEWPSSESDLWNHYAMIRAMIETDSWQAREKVRYVGYLDLLIDFTERIFNQGLKSIWDKFSPQHDARSALR